MSQFFMSGDQSIGASRSALVLPMNIQVLVLNGLILPSMELSRVLQHHSSKASVLWCLAFFLVQLSHLYMATGKIIALTIPTFVSKVMSLLFNVLSRLVIAFLLKSKCLYFMAAVTIHRDFGAQENKSLSLFPFLHIYLP